MKTITLRDGKERALLRGHPWIYDNAIASGSADSGELVRINAHDGKFLAWAAFSPTSKIRARAWSFDEAQRIDATFFIALCARAVSARQRFGSEAAMQSGAGDDGVRLVHGEADGLPGVIVDRYGDTLVAQFLSAGAERFKAEITAALLQATGLAKLYERSDASSRTLEGLPPAKGWLAGQGAEGEDVEVTIREHDWLLKVSISEGHKTGFYLDQRDNRLRFAQDAARLKFRRMLNCYCYTGGFTVAALVRMKAAGVLAGARITSVDSSGPALERAKANVALNGLQDCLVGETVQGTAQDATPGSTQAIADFLDADVNASLREFIKEGRTFDAIILDPPKFAPSAAHAERAARAYKDINRLAFKLLEPGGLLYTFSCSGGIGAELFHKIVAGAAMDAQVDGYLTAHLNAAPDHPITMRFPEGEYLKGLVIMKK